MNPNLELQEVILNSIENEFGDDCNGFPGVLFNDIRNWMDRNGIVFYQP